MPPYFHADLLGVDIDMAGQVARFRFAIQETDRKIGQVEVAVALLPDGLDAMTKAAWLRFREVMMGAAEHADEVSGLYEVADG
jgi:hypothetical protein